MDFPENVLTAEQRAQRADRVLENLIFQMKAWRWECLGVRGQRLMTRTWSRMQSDLLAGKRKTR